MVCAVFRETSRDRDLRRAQRRSFNCKCRRPAFDRRLRHRAGISEATDSRSVRSRARMSILRATAGNSRPSIKRSSAVCRFLRFAKACSFSIVALGGTLKLDIPGHKLPDQKDNDIQSLRSQKGAVHRFEKVNSSHHQAVDSSGQVSKSKRGARMTMSSSKSGFVIIRSLSASNIIPSAARFTIHYSKISLHDSSRRRVKIYKIKNSRSATYPF